MHPVVVRHLIHPLHERLKGKRTYAHLRTLERTQWLSPEGLAHLQRERLRRHLEFAYREIPYYTRLFDEHGLVPGHVDSPDELARIPCLTRELIREHYDDLHPRRRPRRVQRMSTGGSTGTPVTVLVDAERAAFTDAVRLRAHRWFDVDVGARELVLWGSPIETGKQDWLRTLRDRLVNSRLLSAFDLGPRALDEYARILREYRPDKLYGYASALHLFAAYLSGAGWAARPGWPRVVFTTAEPLYDFQRAAIASAFGCPVSNEYGARDAGLIANECPAGGFHIAAEGMVVEVLPHDDAATMGGGELVVTNLESHAMPIIRYRTGDVGALEPDPCACGRGLPRLRRVDGRQTDFLVTPDGRVMHALAVIYVLREIPSVQQFQVVQDRLEHVAVRIVPGAGFSGATGRAIVDDLRRLFGGSVAVDVEPVESIPSGSGKHRYVISQVAGEHLAGLGGHR